MDGGSRDFGAARNYIELGQLDEALDELERVLDARGPEATTHYLLGSVYHLKGLVSLADDHYESACRLDSSFAEQPYGGMGRGDDGQECPPPPPPPECPPPGLKKMAALVEVRRHGSVIGSRSITVLDDNLVALVKVIVGGLLTATGNPALESFSSQERPRVLQALTLAVVRCFALDGSLEVGGYLDQFGELAVSLEEAVAGQTEDIEEVMARWVLAQFVSHPTAHGGRFSLLEDFQNCIGDAMASLTPVIEEQSGEPRVTNWDRQARLLSKKMEKLGLAELPFRYDLEKGRYYWMEGKRTMGIASLTLLGSYSTIGSSFMAGWANRSAPSKGAFLEPIAGFPDTIEEISLERAQGFVRAMAQLTTVEHIQVVKTGQLVLFLGLSDLRRPTSKERFAGASPEAAAKDTLRKLERLREQLTFSLMAPQELARLCFDFAARLEAQAGRLFQATPVGEKLLRTAKAFKAIGKGLGRRKFLLMKRDFVPQEEADRYLDQLAELEKEWS